MPRVGNHQLLALSGTLLIVAVIACNGEALTVDSSVDNIHVDYGSALDEGAGEGPAKDMVAADQMIPDATTADVPTPDVGTTDWLPVPDTATADWLTTPGLDSTVDSPPVGPVDMGVDSGLVCDKNKVPGGNCKVTGCPAGSTCKGCVDFFVFYACVPVGKTCCDCWSGSLC